MDGESLRSAERKGFFEKAPEIFKEGEVIVVTRIGAGTAKGQRPGGEI